MFTTAEEMDRNARKWLAILIPAILGIAAISIVSIVLTTNGDDVLIAIASLFGSVRHALR